MFPRLVLAGLFIICSFFLHSNAKGGLQRPPGCPTCPLISSPPRPNPTFTRPPRTPLYPPGLHLLPRQPNTNPGRLANRARILFITQELKRNITYDPQNYTGTWVGNNYCLFKGFYCDTVPDLNITGLAGILFNGARFGGRFLNFYRFIRNLPDIAIFHANSNNFTGVINRNLNQLRYLYELDLSNNVFPGGFPASVIGAKNLTFVDVRFNKYAGPVPATLFNVDTDVLFINNNGFNQTIPRATFGNTPALFLTLANNKFTGTIPSTIGRAWRTLLEVLFLNNRLTGCLPFQIGYLIKATVFDVGGNILTGPIPQSFGCLAKLQLLNLAHNEFYGTIPENLCRLPNAYNFSLSYNYFSQVGPACLRLIRAKRLDVRRNCIVGLPQQKSAAECTRFFARAKTCPLESTFNIVPCTLRPATNMAALDEEDEAAEGRRLATIDEMTPPSPRTYAALKPPHH